jgi:hypothetical protein
VSDTPRTDAVAEPRGEGWEVDVVPVEFARRLERELIVEKRRSTYWYDEWLREVGRRVVAERKNAAPQEANLSPGSPMGAPAVAAPEDECPDCINGVCNCPDCNGVCKVCCGTGRW